MTTGLRYSRAPITEANWESAFLLTDALPGSAGTYTATVDDLGGTVYLALKTRNAEGAWSALSNYAFWPRQDLFLPIVVRGDQGG